MKKMEIILITIVLVAIVIGATIYFVFYYGKTGPTEKKTEIVVGASISLSGVFSKHGEEIKRFYEFWEYKVNSEGGIYVPEYGKKLPVRLILFDDRSDPSVATTVYEKLITQDKVDFVLAPYSSTITAAVSTVVEKYHYPLITIYASTPSIYRRGYEYLFSLQPPGNTHTWSFLNMCTTLGVETLAIITPKQTWPLTQAQGALNYSQKIGINVVLYEEVEPDIADLSSIIIKLQQLRPDAIIAGGDYHTADLFMRQSKELNYRPKIGFLSNVLSLPEFIDSWGEDLEGFCDFYTAAVKFLNTAEANATRELYIELFGREPSEYWFAYESCQILQQSIEKAGLDKEAIRNTLLSQVFSTIMGAVKFDEFEGQKYLNVYATTWVVQIQHGKPELVWPPSWFGINATSTPIYPIPSWEGLSS
jgi:branched-chain amino acid transport system substrate-binding protein